MVRMFENDPKKPDRKSLQKEQKGNWEHKLADKRKAFQDKQRKK